MRITQFSLILIPISYQVLADIAAKTRKYPDRRLIHHSDRGLQYCNPDYLRVLAASGVEISMTAKYDPYGNAVAERVNGILKTEYEIGEGFIDQKDARREINHAIWLYNTDRPHLSCKNLTPVEAQRLENFPLKKWTTKFSSRDMSREENKLLTLDYE